METSTKTVTSKELALLVLKRNHSRIERVKDQVRKDMNRPKFIDMDADIYEEEWNRRIEELMLDTNF